MRLHCEVKPVDISQVRGMVVRDGVVSDGVVRDGVVSDEA